MKRMFSLLLFFVAAMSVQTVQAQTNGDVNDDGVVNEQDNAAILEIMAEAGGVKEQTKYYWYVGQENPASMTPPSIGDANKLLCEWTEITSTPSKITIYKTDETWNEHYWFIAVPTEYGFNIYDNGNTNITNLFTSTTKTIANVNYTIYKFSNLSDTIDCYLAK